MLLEPRIWNINVPHGTVRILIHQTKILRLRCARKRKSVKIKRRWNSSWNNEWLALWLVEYYDNLSAYQAMWMISVCLWVISPSVNKNRARRKSFIDPLRLVEPEKTIARYFHRQLSQVFVSLFSVHYWDKRVYDHQFSVLAVAADWILIVFPDLFIALGYGLTY